MKTPSGLTNIKWAGPNTVVIEIESNNARLYVTKNEALDLIDAVTMFMESYPGSFSMDRINDIDSAEQWDWK